LAFKNRLLLFPGDIRREIDRLIIQSDPGPYIIEKFLKKTYQGKLKIPSAPTIAAYLQWRKEQLAQKNEIVEGVKQELKNANQSINEIEVIDGESFSSKAKKVALGDLIDKCYKRLEDLERIDAGTLSATMESNIISYIAEIRRIIETLLKLSGELREDDQVVVNIIDQKIGYFFQQVAKTIKEVYGTDKFEEFRIKLKRNLNNPRVQ